jgi:hypothetical protein
MEEIPITTVVGLAGFFAGMIFGGVANLTNFCTMGALSDIVFMEDYGRFRTWLLAIAVAIITSQTLHVMGWWNYWWTFIWIWHDHGRWLRQQESRTHWWR